MMQCPTKSLSMRGTTESGSPSKPKGQHPRRKLFTILIEIWHNKAKLLFAAMRKARGCHPSGPVMDNQKRWVGSLRYSPSSLMTRIAGDRPLTMNIDILKSGILRNLSAKNNWPKTETVSSSSFVPVANLTELEASRTKYLVAAFEPRPFSPIEFFFVVVTYVDKFHFLRKRGRGLHAS